MDGIAISNVVRANNAGTVTVGMNGVRGKNGEIAKGIGRYRATDAMDARRRDMRRRAEAREIAIRGRIHRPKEGRVEEEAEAEWAGI